MTLSFLFQFLFSYEYEVCQHYQAEPVHHGHPPVELKELWAEDALQSRIEVDHCVQFLAVLFDSFYFQTSINFVMNI